MNVNLIQRHHSFSMQATEEEGGYRLQHGHATLVIPIRKGRVSQVMREYSRGMREVGHAEIKNKQLIVRLHK